MISAHTITYFDKNGVVRTTTRYDLSLYDAVSHLRILGYLNGHESVIFGDGEIYGDGKAYEKYRNIQQEEKQ